MILYNPKHAQNAVNKSIFVYEEMKKELLTNAWDFSQKIIINDLIEKFNVSRRPVMDAMKMLENDGFVTIIPQSGCKVIDYSPKDLQDQLRLSRALESLCTELAVENHTAHELESMEELQNKMKKDFSKIENKLDYFAYNRDFHLIILSMTKSPKIAGLAVQMWDLLDFYLIHVFEDLQINVIDAWNEHNQIFDAIKNNDIQKAREVMEDHLNSYIKKVPFSLH